MRLKDVKSKELAERLGKYGVSLSEHSLNNKLSRGGFSAEFFFQCMMALGVRELRDEEWRAISSKREIRDDFTLKNGDKI